MSAWHILGYRVSPHHTCAEAGTAASRRIADSAAKAKGPLLVAFVVMASFYQIWIIAFTRGAHYQLPLRRQGACEPDGVPRGHRKENGSTISRPFNSWRCSAN